MIKHLIPVPLFNEDFQQPFNKWKDLFFIGIYFLIYPITMARVKVVAMNKDEASDLALSDVFVMLPMRSGRSFRSSSTEVMLTSLAPIELPLHSPVRETLTPTV